MQNPLSQSEWLTADFDFHLPPHHIAQHAIEPRDHARLLHVSSDVLADKHVYELPDVLHAGDLLVMNDTKVMPARLHGRRGEIAVEILLLKKQSPQTWLAFARPGKRLHVGDTVVFAPAFAAEVLDKHPGGHFVLRFLVPDSMFSALLDQHGEAPLPPYIKRADGATRQDQARYQTIYAVREGAIAAPTAGLHFTPELLARFAFKNIEYIKVTLHVGAGTFLPVKAEKVTDHVMHAEWGEVTADVAGQINRARTQGRRIVAIGTTSLRVLESAAGPGDNVFPFQGETSIFIYPGYQFKVVDTLMTNFHLPRSTLFMLVSAFAGLERMRRAYAHAMVKNYRFYSYGDATLLEKHL
jgi:S-adenosylmethionine:tRNA ribosyltransferase-isomerase